MRLLQNFHFTSLSHHAFFIACMLSVCAVSNIHAQNNVGIGTAYPDSTAVLDVTSSEKGILLPRMSSASRELIASPAIGLTVFDSTANAYYYFDGELWQKVVAGRIDIQNGLYANDSCYLHFAEGPQNTNGTYEYIDDFEPWQSFTMENDGYLDSILMALDTFHGGYIRVYEGEGIGGDLLHQHAVPGAIEVFEVPFPDQQIFLRSGGKYTVSLEDTVDQFQWYIGLGNPYSGGVSSSGGDGDRLFITYFWFCSPNFIIDPPDADGNTDLHKIDAIHFASGVTFTGNKINDTDGDTRITLEQSPDEDLIRFFVNNKEYFRMDKGRIITSNFIENIAIGSASTLSEVTTGESNIGIARSALHGVTSGKLNIGIGIESGGITTGDENICIGLRTGSGTQSGSRNVMVGSRAGQGVINRSGNVFIGYRAGENANDSNLLYIENTESSTPLIYGEFDNDLLRINGTLDINDNYAFPTTDGTSGQILQTDGLGNLSWTQQVVDTSDQLLSLSGSDLSISDGNTVDLSAVNTDAQTLMLTGDSLTISNGNTLDLSPVNKIQPTISDTDNDTKIQVEETAGENRIRFDIGGQEYFIMDSARLQILHSGHSVFIGEEAGANDDLSNNSNTFIGYRTGKNVSNGAQNVALGYYALSNNVSGVENTAIGNGALATTLGNRNTTLGWYALGLCPGGNDNVVIGRSAMDFVTTNVTNNVVIGTNAGYASSGSSNVLIGNDVGQGISESNRLMIDNSNTNDPLIYGEFDNDVLRVNGTLNINQAYSLPDSDGTQGQYLITNGAGLASWKTNNILHDLDGDTKIQVEEAADEDVIRFDVAESERLKLDDAATISGIGRALLTVRTNDNNTETGIAFRNSGGLYSWSMHRTIGVNPDFVISGGILDSAADLLTERFRITNQGNVLIGGNLSVDTLEMSFVKGNAQLDSAEVLSNLSASSVTISDSIQIGSNGTALHGMIAMTVSEQVPFLPSNAETFIDFAVPGATMNSVVHISPSDELPDGILIGQAYVSAPDTVSVKFVNYETSGNVQFTMDYRIAVINF